MLAFTFPGQGSQRPGMGRPWVDHESWELVDEASEVAERDVADLLLDADADELRDTRNAQLTTFVSSLIVLDAVERLGIEPSFCAGHSLGEYTALTATGALGFDDGVRLVRERAEAMHEAGADTPGHDGRRARARRRPGRGRLPARRRGRVGRQLQRARPGRHRRLTRGRRRGQRHRQGARRQEGHAAAGVGRLPHAVHDPGPRPAAQGDRRGQPARHRGARRLQRRRPAPPRRAGVGQPAVGAAHIPVRWKHCLLELRRARRHRVRRARPGRRAHRHGEAHVDGAARSRVATPRTSTSCSSGCTRRDRPVRRGSRASTSSPSSGSSSVRRRRLPSGAGLADGTPSTSAPCSATSATRGRSPFAGVLQSYIAVDGERVTARQPIAWLRTSDGLTMPRHPTGVRGAIITGWGTALPPKMLTNQDLEEMVDTATSGSSSAPASASAASAARPPGCRSSPGARRSSMSGGSIRRSIDAVVLATTTPDRTVPATSAHRSPPELGLRCGAFDVNAACSGFTYDGRGPRPHRDGRRAGCSSSAPTRWPGSPTGPTATPRSSFADGSGAVVLEASTGRASCSAGTSTPTARGRALPLRRDRRLHRRWTARRSSAAPCGSWSTRRQKSMAHAGVTADDIALVVPHQANIRIIQAACDRLGIPHGPGRRRARTTPATRRRPSIPLALVDASTTAGCPRATSCCSSASGPA